MTTLAVTTPTAVKTLSLHDYQNPLNQKRFVSELIASLKAFGFVVIKDHDINQSLLKQSYELNQQLFELSLPSKLAYAKADAGQRGYTAFGKERAKDNPQPDLKEFWHVGPELNTNSHYFSQYPPNIWPSELSDFKSVMLQLYTELSATAAVLLEAIGVGFNIPDNYFPNLIEDGNSVLRLIHYPPIQGMNTAQQMRAAPHADINLMTLLVGASDSGLQLQDRHGDWLDVGANTGEIIVDTGDMMALISGGVLPATVHRVVNPDNKATARYSMPFFLHPHSNAELAYLPEFRSQDKAAIQSSITAGEFLQQRLRENGLAD